VVVFGRADFCTFELIPHRLFVLLGSSFKRFRSCFCDCIHPQSPSIHYTSDQTLPLTKHHKTQPDLTPTTSSSTTHPPTNQRNHHNVFPQIHALPQMHHARSATHAHVSQERGRRRLAGDLLRKLQSHLRQRQRSLSVLLADR
jgi:hypothetical protein